MDDNLQPKRRELTNTQTKHQTPGENLNPKSPEAQAMISRVKKPSK